MAGVKVVNFPAAVPIATDILPFIDDPAGAQVDSKATFAELAELAGFRKAVLTADHTLASTTGTEMADLQFGSLVAGTYLAEYFLLCSSSSTTVGLKFGLNYTGTLTKMVNSMLYPTAGTTAATGIADGTNAVLTGTLVEQSSSITETTSAGNLGPFTGVVTANEDFWIWITSLFVASNGGDFEIYHGSEAATNTSVEVGSVARLTRFA